MKLNMETRVAASMTLGNSRFLIVLAKSPGGANIRARRERGASRRCFHGEIKLKSENPDLMTFQEKRSATPFPSSRPTLDRCLALVVRYWGNQPARSAERAAFPDLVVLPWKMQ